MFKKILIANRGEIACRIIKTCKAMNVKTVAVYSDADKHALHVDMADESMHIGGSLATESYLDIDKIIKAAKNTGAEAIHPGYGFLSENTDFANAILEAGLIFIGPKAESIEAIGEKSRAKKLMEKAKVPLLVGYHGDDQTEKTLIKHAKDIGYPLLIKASAGGGGKGMRIVENEKDFSASLISAKREALSSFGNDHVLIEKYLKDPRHIEVQVFGDTHGNYITLSERDCSVQRRQQKIIEEAPAPELSDTTRTKLSETSITVAKSIDYNGAGTVEFLMDKDENFYFMEMNTRLQVEHPVTEMVTGLDLVEWQLRVASGEKLPLTQDKVKITGHAIETRIYAEDPANDFLPATGKIQCLKWPRPNDSLRIETGIRESDEVSAFYDPMIAKLVTHGENRNEACLKMAEALNTTYIVGPKNNISFLEQILLHPAFKASKTNIVSTGFISSYYDELLEPSKNISEFMLAIAGLGLLINQLNSNYLLGWRLNSESTATRNYSFDENKVSCTILKNGEILLKVNDNYSISASMPKNHCPGAFSTIIAGQEYTVTAIHNENKLYLFVKGLPHIVINWVDPINKESQNSNSDGALTAPMTGRIIAMHVNNGDKVKIGQAMAVMEAMKMEHTIYASISGTVSNINVAVDEQVNEGIEIITLL